MVFSSRLFSVSCGPLSDHWFPTKCARGPRARHVVATQSQIDATPSLSRRPLSAVRRSLAGLPLHQASGGRLVAPVLQPQVDNIPFGLAISLQTQTARGQLPISAREDDLYELQYVLEGKGELQASSGSVQTIAAGDSILAPIGRAWCHLPVDQQSDLSHLAVLTLLVPGALPHEDDQHTQNLVDSASHAMEAWTSHPVVGSLPEDTVSILLQNAKAQAVHAEDSWQQFQQSVAAMTETQDAAAATSSTHQCPNLADSDALVKSAPTHQPVTAHSSSQQEVPTSARNEPAWLPARWHGYRMLVPTSQKVFQNFVSATRQLLSNNVVQWLWPDQCIMKKTLSELNAFQLPNQTNRLALMFDPTDHEVPFTFGVEIFEEGHKTNPHTHAVSHELFFILAGEGEGFCDSERFSVKAGDVVVFPPTSLHGIDNGPTSKMYCLELMLPNDMFAEFVKGGKPAGALRDDDMCIMIAQGCASA